MALYTHTTTVRPNTSIILASILISRVIFMDTIITTAIFPSDTLIIVTMIETSTIGAKNTDITKNIAMGVTKDIKDTSGQQLIATENYIAGRVIREDTIKRLKSIEGQSVSIAKEKRTALAKRYTEAAKPIAVISERFVGVKPTVATSGLIVRAKPMAATNALLETQKPIAWVNPTRRGAQPIAVERLFAAAVKGLAAVVVVLNANQSF